MRLHKNATSTPVQVARDDISTKCSRWNMHDSHQATFCTTVQHRIYVRRAATTGTTQQLPALNRKTTRTKNMTAAIRRWGGRKKKGNNFWCVCVCERECPGNNSCLLLLLCVCVPRLTTWHRDPVWVIMTCHRWFPAEVVHRPTSGAFPLINCRPTCPHKTTTTTTISRHPFPGIHSSGAKVLNSTNNNR